MSVHQCNRRRRRQQAKAEMKHQDPDTFELRRRRIARRREEKETSDLFLDNMARQRKLQAAATDPGSMLVAKTKNLLDEHQSDVQIFLVVFLVVFLFASLGRR